MARELPTFKVELNAFELGILVGSLSKLKLPISERIWKVTREWQEVKKEAQS